MTNEKALVDNIPYQTLVKLHNNYVSSKHKILTSAMGKEDTKSIWFELDGTFRTFLEETLKDKNVNGVRMYFMEYPDKQTEIGGELIPIKPSDVSQLTVGMVTTQNVGGRYQDYPTSSGGFKLLFAPPINHGELCPNSCF